MELPGEDRGGDPSPRPGMTERESKVNMLPSRAAAAEIGLTSCLWIGRNEY